MTRIHVVVDDRELKRLLDGLRAQGEIVRIVADGVDYGIYVEMDHMAGQTHVPARPFMTPAVEEMRPKFGKALAQAKDLTQLEAIVDKVAFDVVARAKARAPVDTGMLKNTIHVITDESFATTFTKHRKRTPAVSTEGAT